MNSPRSKQRAIIRKSESVAHQRVSAGTFATSQVLLGVEDGMPHFAMRKFRMEAGGGMPRHTNAVEHEQYVLQGRARVTLGEQVVEVGANDVVFIPAGLAHDYTVLEAPFEFLCLVPNLPDRIEIEKES